MRHFEVDLGGTDPFFVEGQEDVIAMQKEHIRAKQTENIYQNAYVRPEVALNENAPTAVTSKVMP